MSILDDILAHKRGEVTAAQRAVPLAQLQAKARAQTPARGFARALRAGPVEKTPRLCASMSSRMLIGPAPPRCDVPGASSSLVPGWS